MQAADGPVRGNTLVPHPDPNDLGAIPPSGGQEPQKGQAKSSAKSLAKPQPTVSERPNHYFDKFGLRREPGLPNVVNEVRHVIGLQPPTAVNATSGGQWFTKDPETDGVEGTRTDRAYTELGLDTVPSPTPLIVAVIDSGFDTDHEDMQGTTPAERRWWTNPGEVAGDNIDNDGNGYIDDVNGWNFLGTVKDGQAVSIGGTNLEMVREKVRLEKLADERPLTSEERQYLDDTMAAISAARWRFPGRYLNEEGDTRAAIIGDDPYDYSDRDYGNNLVQGPHGSHGTHVGTTIGAIRDNAVGILGIASDVKVMPIRAVPDGDEYDKDIVNAIYYAVDNGAKIINMSFGKSHSPGKAAVDEAFRYAASKGVLIVQAAGNDSTDLDNNTSYPNKYVGNDRSHRLPAWITVGASGQTRSRRLPASFSNYGKNTVDVFAPGVGIRAGVPGSQYASMSGTSMASPVAAGVAAVVWSQYPQLTAQEIKEAIESSVRTYPDLEVRKPGGFFSNLFQGDVPFSELSRTGGVVDLLSALRAASKLAAAKEPNAS